MKEKAKDYINQINEILENSSCQSAGLMEGKSGLSLYYYVLYRVFREECYAQKSITLFNQACADPEEITMSDSLSYSLGFGKAGLNDLANYYKKEAFFEVSEGPDSNEILLLKAKELIQQHNFDYLKGSIGIMHYFLRRNPDEEARSYVKLLIDELLKEAGENNWGIYFESGDRDPNCKICFGLIHGMAGILIVLVKAYHYGAETEALKELILKTANFIMSYRQGVDILEGKYSFFPKYIDSDGKPHFNSRLAWSDGDLGVAFTLYKVNEILKSQSIAQMAEFTGLNTIMTFKNVLNRFNYRDIATKITDSNFKNGTAGVAHLYRKLYEMSGNRNYRESYEYWIGETLDYLSVELPNGHYKDKETSLLEGLPGIGLTLLSYISEEELNWGEILLL
ncbi:Lanthionine synthetase C-like protein [Pseudarcicella hirudinis]|uniref:Lanthionine synthetase C-like protein n=1 Tax=Pseudarcicella hirudinis TaxID=1079859 RepID=A0A1I5TR97_9BACT|nr:lanthionine synthetase LanC family protein [Pseudarcicella hirudinis]SFP85602.1 Lanthionine synthetase C-like protein [Pseudarcicella hirudinis]